MNSSNQYILDSIKTWVWSGFYDRQRVQEMIGDILDEHADEALLRAAVEPEFDEKAAAEATWPDETDCDRLDRAFKALNDQGIIALHNAGYTMSDGLDDVGQKLEERGHDNVQGYCFYHGQDVESAVGGSGLTIAFGGLDGDKSARCRIGYVVEATLQAHGLVVEWNGDPDQRLEIPNMDWKRRGPE